MTESHLPRAALCVAFASMMAVPARVVLRAAGTAAPHVTGPIAGAPFIGSGAMTTEGLAAVRYVEAEYFIEGTATAYAPTRTLGPDGQWPVRPGERAAYTTRILVRRPANRRDFNGTVMVEWNNVTGGNDGGVDFNYMKEEILRGGYAWVGVSAQAVGVTKLKTENASRYGALVHPGDPYSYDIFTEAARVVRMKSPVDVFRRADGKEDIRAAIKRVIAAGRSQSAGRLVTYVNAVHPLVKAYDGFLVHSRGRAGASLTGQQTAAMPADTRIRADVSVPVLVVQAEGDVRGSFTSRQPASAHYRRWEIAGTSHAGLRDSDEPSRYVVEVPPALPSGPGCKEPINIAPHNAVTKAALHAITLWVQKRAAPPQSADLEIDATQKDPIVRDARGFAKGGIRLPEVEVPTAVVDGRVNEVARPQPGGQNFCNLYGTTRAFDAATLKALYPTHEAFVSKFKAAVANIVREGYWLQPEADEAVAFAERSSIGRGDVPTQSRAPASMGPPANRIINTTLNVADLDRASAFFTRAFGMHEKNRRPVRPGVIELSIGYSHDPGAVELMLVTSKVATDHGEGARPSSGWGRVILQVMDVKSVCGKVSGNGGHVIRPPADNDSVPVIVAMVEDPDGHRFELVQFK